MPITTPERTKAQKIQASYAEQSQQIRDDALLSDEGRQQALAALWASVAPDLAALQSAEENRLTTRFRQLEREVFGPSARYGADAATLAISVRDAQDRAADLTAQQALDLLARAERNQDENLARAVAQRAVDASKSALGADADTWREVFSLFLSRRPAMEPLVTELADIELLADRQMFSPFNLPQPRGVSAAAVNAAVTARNSVMSAR